MEEYNLPDTRKHWIETAIRLFDLQHVAFLDLEKVRNSSETPWTFSFGCWNNAHLLDCYWDEFIERVKLRTPESQFTITTRETPVSFSQYLQGHKYHDHWLYITRRLNPIVPEVAKSYTITPEELKTIMEQNFFNQTIRAI